jgi:hypothetical protein
VNTKLIVPRVAGLLFLASTTIACSREPPLIPQSTDTSTPFSVDANWVTVQALEQIPAPVLKALQARFKDNRRLADRGQPFDATDVVSGLPTRRLVLAGYTSTEWFVTYEHGGRGHHLDVIVLDVRQAAPHPVSVTPLLNVGGHNDRDGWRVTLEDLLPTLTSARTKMVDDETAHY